MTAVPETIHFCGLIPGAEADETELRARLVALLRPVGAAYGQLAAGADIAVVELLLAQGAEVTCVLPFPPELYLEQSVRPGGAAWIPRYRKCLDQADLQVLAAAPRGDQDYAEASQAAMAQAREHARRTGARCWQLAIWDGRGGPGPAGTAADVRTWQQSGGDTIIVPSPWPRR